MNKKKLFNTLWDTFKFTEIDFEEIVKMLKEVIDCLF